MIGIEYNHAGVNISSTHIGEYKERKILIQGYKGFTIRHYETDTFDFTALELTLTQGKELNTVKVFANPEDLIQLRDNLNEIIDHNKYQETYD